MSINRRQFLLACGAALWSHTSYPFGRTNWPDRRLSFIDFADSNQTRADKERDLGQGLPNSGKKINCIPDGICTASRWTWEKTKRLWIPLGAPYIWQGNFDAEVRDGLATITGKIKLAARDNLLITSEMKASWKSEIEGFWNDKFQLHQQQSLLADTCCPASESDRQILQLRIVCEFVEEDQHVTVNCHRGAAADPWGNKNGWHANKWWELNGKMGTKARALIFGRCIGYDNEYKGRATFPEIKTRSAVVDASRKLTAHHSPLTHHYCGIAEYKMSDRWLQAIETITKEKFKVVML